MCAIPPLKRVGDGFRRKHPKGVITVIVPTAWVGCSPPRSTRLPKGPWRVFLFHKPTFHSPVPGPLHPIVQCIWLPPRPLHPSSAERNTFTNLNFLSMIAHHLNYFSSDPCRLGFGVGQIHGGRSRSPRSSCWIMQRL